MDAGTEQLLGSTIRSKRIIPFCALCLLGLIVVGERAHSLHAAVDRDVAGYAVIGHELLHGRELYSDLWERKPPLLYAGFSAAERLVGYGPQELFLLNVFFSLIAMAGIYCAGKAGGRGCIGGMCAAGLWAILCDDLLLQADQPNAELFLNAFLSCAVALVFHNSVMRVRAAVLLGFLFTAATLYKHHALVICGSISAGYVFCHRGAILDQSRGENFWRRLSAMLIVAGIVCLSWAALFVYFYDAGRLGAMVDVLFKQNAAYAGNVFGNLCAGLSLNLLLPASMDWVGWPIVLTIAAGISAVLLGRRKLTGDWKIWLCWAAGTWLTISLPRGFYPHYYQLWLPVFCVGGGWAASALITRFKIVGACLVIFCYSAVIIREGRNYFLPQEEWVHRAYLPAAYFDNDFFKQADLGHQLDKALGPQETFWNFGCENTLYFSAHRSPPSGLLYLEPLVRGPDVDEYWQRLMADLNRTRPDVVVVSLKDAAVVPGDAPIFPWLARNYMHSDAIISPGYAGFEILVRLNSPIQRRLHRSAERPQLVTENSPRFFDY